MPFFNFKIPESLVERLRVESAMTGAPASEIVRRAIAFYLDFQDSQRQAQALRQEPQK